MWRLKAINLVTTPMVKNMFMMEEEMDKKKEMYVVYAYVMELGSDFIPSDAASEGSLKWFCKIERIMAEDALGAYYLG